MSEDGTNPMWVTCNACQHRWIGLYLPMPIRQAAKAMGRLTCPKCANTKIMCTPGSIETTSNTSNSCAEKP